ncbi:hypothetical protein [Methylorubrum sp. SB2]|uniref:hypothetical protein n=1 Tax=Methylorubrum subtropicum TaxID=3138812 RepID=UPI00313EAABA
MTKSAAHLSWDELDDAGLRAGIAAIERRDRQAEAVHADEARTPSRRLARTPDAEAMRAASNPARPGTDASHPVGKRRNPLTKRKVSGSQPDAPPSMDRSGKA